MRGCPGLPARCRASHQLSLHLRRTEAGASVRWRTEQRRNSTPRQQARSRFPRLVCGNAPTSPGHRARVAVIHSGALHVRGARDLLGGHEFTTRTQRSDPVRRGARAGPKPGAPLQRAKRTSPHSHARCEEDPARGPASLAHTTDREHTRAKIRDVRLYGGCSVPHRLARSERVASNV